MRRKLIMTSLLDMIKKHQDKEIEYIDDTIISDNYLLIRLKGPIDAQTLPLIERKSMDEDAFENKHILLNFEKVNHVDTATLATLVKVFHDLKKNDKELGVIHASATLKKYIEILKLGSVVKTFSDEAAALKAFHLQN